MKASIYQERFWLEWQLDPLNSKYNEFLIYNINGHLNLDKLKQAFKALSYKHPLLRSQFYRNEDGLHVQLIEDFKLPFEIVNINLSQPCDIFKIIKETIDIPFDLAHGPLWQARILHVREQQYWLVIMFHHIIIDGNSFDIVRNDLALFYNQPEKIKQLQNTEAYINHFKKSLEAVNFLGNANELIQQGLRYYKDKLANQSLHYGLGKDSDEQVSFFFSLDKSIRNQIKNFCQNHDCKLFRFMAVIYAVFLYRYFGQKKFCITYPVNMRQKADQDILASLINMQLLPIELQPTSTFWDVLTQVVENRQVTQGLVWPYEKIITYLKDENIITNSDSANIVLSETDLKLRPINLDGVQIASIQMPKPSLPYDISLEYECYKDDIYIQLSIKRHWFDASYHSEQIQQDISSIIKCICDYPQISFKQLLLLDKLQQQNMMNLSSELCSYKLCDMRIEEKFEQIVKQYAEEIAIIDSHKKITYSQLAEMVDVIAANLMQKLNSKVRLVGIAMQHSAELIAVILALFKLGRAYLPVVPNLPSAYLKDIINQSQLEVIITDQEINIEVEKQLKINFINDLLTKSSLNLEHNEKIDNDLAYVLFTSGTTGSPKGVMIRHGSIVNLILSCQSFYQISCQDIVPWFHSYGFDYSVWEMWAALLNGGKLLILDDLITRSPRAFTEYMSQHHVTVINQTPTALKQWIIYLTENKAVLPDLSSVRIIISGGEPLYPHNVEALLLNKTPLRCRIFNMYGITEDCVHSTIFEITPNFLRQQYSLIGKMLPGKQALVIDEDCNIKPVGCCGELLISGFGVAQGYFNQPEMTKERFIQLSENELQKIWFKTGDQVRLLPSGGFEYIGRKDTQVKIRGYRIDLKIVEAYLCRLKGVLDAKVILDNNQLFAFLVLDNDVTILNIMSLARANLPHYMLPDRFIKISNLPRTTNNKIDEKKLLAMSKIKIELPDVLSENTTDEITLQIIAIWKRLLPNHTFDLKDNFFDCGGNSILLAALQGHLEKCFSIKFPIIEFFNHSTIAEMTKMVKKYLRVMSV